MPYYVQRDGGSWRITWRKGREARAVARHSPEALAQGFRPDMTLEEAQGHARQKQAEGEVERQARAAARVSALKHRTALLDRAFLPEPDVLEWERVWLPEYKIRDVHWRACQRVISKLALPPTDWFERRAALYEAFIAERFSAGYAKKILRYLNLWGYFFCKRHGTPWEKVPGMTGVWRNRLEAGRGRVKGESLPISPALLADKKGGMKPEHWRWTYYSVALGLRPEEVDLLRPELRDTDRGWNLTKDADGEWVLGVFQPKLWKRGVAPADCWKYIPSVFPEQRLACEMILRGEIAKRPWEGWAKRRLGPGYSLYGGRNYFSGWLRDEGYDLETRKHWLGHLSVKTTEAYDRKTQRGRVFKGRKSGTPG